MAKKQSYVVIDDPVGMIATSAAIRHGHPGRDCNSKCPTLERSRRTGNVKRPDAAPKGAILGGRPFVRRLAALPMLERVEVLTEMIEAVNAAGATLEWIGSTLRGSGKLDSGSVINPPSQAMKGIARQTGMTIDRKGWGKVGAIARQDAKRCNAILDRIDDGRITAIRGKAAELRALFPQQRSLRSLAVSAALDKRQSGLRKSRKKKQ